MKELKVNVIMLGNVPTVLKDKMEIVKQHFTKNI